MPENVKVKVVRLPHGEGIDLPRYETKGSAGMDMAAAVHEPVTLLPMQRALIPTGLAVAIPEGYEGQVRPRSGLSIRHGISCVNCVGTIDSDYRGEVKVPLINLGSEPFVVERAMRIAQMVFSPIAQAQWEDVSELPDSDRGKGGFGHTGN